MIGRSRKREEVLVSPKLMPLGVSSSQQKIADYQRLVPLLGTSAEEEEKQINIMLDDLVKLIKKRTKK